MSRPRRSLPIIIIRERSSQCTSQCLWLRFAAQSLHLVPLAPNPSSVLWSLDHGFGFNVRKIEILIQWINLVALIDYSCNAIVGQRINRCDNNIRPPKMERFFVNEIISDGSVGK